MGKVHEQFKQKEIYIFLKTSLSLLREMKAKTIMSYKYPPIILK